MMEPQSDLAKPLLEKKITRATTGTTRTAETSKTVVLVDDDNSNNNKNNDGGSGSWCDNLVTFFVLPVLLFAQFGILFMTERNVDPRLDWTSINYSIVLFVLTCYLYRKAAEDCCVHNVFLLLMPEIIMDIVLALVLFDKVFFAFIFLLLATLVLSLFVVMSSLYLLFITLTCSDDNDDDEEDAEGADVDDNNNNDVAGVLHV